MIGYVGTSRTYWDYYYYINNKGDKIQDEFLYSLVFDMRNFGQKNCFALGKNVELVFSQTLMHWNSKNEIEKHLLSQLVNTKQSNLFTECIQN